MADHQDNEEQEDQKRQTAAIITRVPMSPIAAFLSKSSRLSGRCRPRTCYASRRHCERRSDNGPCRRGRVLIGVSTLSDYVRLSVKGKGSVYLWCLRWLGNRPAWGPKPPKQTEPMVLPARMGPFRPPVRVQLVELGGLVYSYEFGLYRQLFPHWLPHVCRES